MALLLTVDRTSESVVAETISAAQSGRAARASSRRWVEDGDGRVARVLVQGEEGPEAGAVGEVEVGEHEVEGVLGR
jgi:hypothetical protein